MLCALKIILILEVLSHDALFQAFMWEGTVRTHKVKSRECCVYPGKILREFTKQKETHLTPLRIMI